MASYYAVTSFHLPFPCVHRKIEVGETPLPFSVGAQTAQLTDYYFIYYKHCTLD